MITGTPVSLRKASSMSPRLMAIANRSVGATAPCDTYSCLFVSLYVSVLAQRRISDSSDGGDPDQTRPTMRPRFPRPGTASGPGPVLIWVTFAAVDCFTVGTVD